MKGTDVTEAQLAAADDFLTRAGQPKSVPRAIVKREQLVQLLAWYGAIRAKGKAPGQLVERVEGTDGK